ncbi:hypothetical protein COM55_07665 [Bacillus pseudomycoides]|uniref:hypothetical protein n=1 Tax=Bacillus pseudomycoides TaxID=64104 RepID=UPI000BF79AD7|nr:hypothetical protein [Bacillus pseudomycoides]PGE86628.1 hypothetical protein COM55_07665 [Bacillus pseudomycoides]
MYLVNIFYDVNGNFQWVSMTALVALIVGIIGPSISIYNNKKTLEKQEQMNIRNLDLQKQINISNFKGNVVSKSRIEWIQEVRKKSVDFMSACYNLFEFIRSSDENPINKEEFLKLKHEVEKHGTLLILYFGPDSNKNNELVVCIVATILELTSNRKGWYPEEELPILADQVDVLRDFLRIYFKAEWKRANGEIKDSQVQEYLEKDDIYRRIKRIYNDKLENHSEWMECFYNDLEERYTPNL